jgi:hypothetical protein
MTALERRCTTFDLGKLAAMALPGDSTQLARRSLGSASGS